MNTTPASSIPLAETAIMATCEQPSLSAQRSIRSESSIPIDDFSMTDLNDIHSHLWIAGGYGNISTLHHQRVLLRDIIPSEQLRLHLVWFDRTIYIKPLPDCLLKAESYSDKDPDPSGLILGFLRSYCSLIRFPVDLAIAKERNLISKDVTWEQWLTIREGTLNATENSHVNRRYEYGELRLGRLDIIHRLTGRGLTYFTVHRTYKTYFAQYFSLFGTVFVFVAVILAAMQVLIVIPNIPKKLATTCYRFSVAVLMGVCLGVGFVLLVFLYMFVDNFVRTRVAHRGDKASAS